MPRWIVLLLGLGALSLAGCSAHDEREWMKVDRRYSNEDLQRDYRDCSRRGDLDDACMRQRGWIPMSPTKEEPPRSLDPLQRQPSGRGRY
jgi:hypothetical protein